jgi:hypothetical protein
MGAKARGDSRLGIVTEKEEPRNANRKGGPGNGNRKGRKKMKPSRKEGQPQEERPMVWQL